ncbi:hypothetical protein DIPPA_09655 [Diplonema papillatum]|nr:hypothetical protein DIPPA_09655 [Diplonema papillatum]
MHVIQRQLNEGMSKLWQDTCRPVEGYLEKYSIGSKLTLRRNWKKRYMRSTARGITYYRGESDLKPKGDVPYTYNTTLVPDVDATIHAEAKEPGYWYFAVRFSSEKGASKLLLLRTASRKEKEMWCSALSTVIAKG